MRLIRKNPAAVGIKIGHHDLDCLIIDDFRTIPLMTIQGPSHAATMVGAEPHDCIAIKVKFHLMKPAGAECSGLIINTVVGAVLHDNGIRAGRKGGAGQKSEHADERQEETNETLLRSRDLFQFFHADKLLFTKFARKKPPSCCWKAFVL